MKGKQMVLTRFMDSLNSYELPTWEELPKLDLYMDQVITLMEEYLRIYHAEKEKLITPSMINNYVKLGVIPKPNKKRYGRLHLAYLIMVCSLKQVVSISVIQQMLPLSLTEKEVEQAYSAFTAAQKQVASVATKQVMDAMDDLYAKENAAFSDFSGFSVQVALTGSIYKILSELIVENLQEIMN